LNIEDADFTDENAATTTTTGTPTPQQSEEIPY